MIEIVRVVLSSFPDPESAAEFVKTMVEERTVACANILPPAKSFYIWQGELKETDETVVIFKIPTDRMTRFEMRLKDLHPYEVPELISLRPDHVLPAYASWVEGNI